MSCKAVTRILGNIGSMWNPRPDRPYQLEELSGDTMLIREGRIAWTGERSQLPASLNCDAEELDCQQAMLLPGFVDAHTHPVFYAQRADEYEMRNQGRSYLEIQQAGGGILSSRRSLMDADPEDLKARVKERLKHFLRLGTTRIEAKSGYGLSVTHELLSLRILKELKEELPLSIHPTLLAAHSIPPEYRDRREEWFERIENEILPVVKAEGLAEFADAFCEPKVITLEETRRVMQAAQRAGLGIHLHADQIEACGGGALAAELGALSADHLEQIDEAGIRAMVRAGTVFSLLPGSTYFLGMDDYAPARRIIEAGGHIALCTDYNPGSSHTQSMPFILSLATCRMKMTAREAIWAATAGGARALGLGHAEGSLERGAPADLALWPFAVPEELPYTLGDNRPLEVLVAGQTVAQNAASPRNPVASSFGLVH
jgi:imidazolonepropionase